MTPAKPASHAPRQNTMVKSCETLMPVTRAISGSSTPARIIAPSRVRSSSAHSPTAKITAMTLMARRYVGKARLPTAVTPRSALGVATWMGSPVHTMRQTSAIMKDRPSVTSTCASSAPGRRRRMNRSTIPPNTATSNPLRTAAVQKSTPRASRLVARYAPSMKNEPWVRLGIFIRPKISEKPAERRKRRPPSVMLLTLSTSQRLMSRRPLAPVKGPRSALQRGIVARVHGLREEPLFVIRPELAHLRKGLDRRVDELVALPLAPPDVEAPDDVAEVVERELPARRVGERYGAQRPVERLPVVGLAAGLLERRFRDHPGDVETGGVGARDVAVVAHHPVDQPLVARRVEIVRVEVARDHPERLVAEGLQERIVAGRRAGEDRELEPLIFVLLHELQRVRSGESLDDGVDAADLREVGRVVGRHEWRPQLLHDPAARVLEDALEAGHLLVAEREVVGDRDHALELQLLRRVVGQRVQVLRRGAGGPDEIRVGPALRHVLRGGEAEDRHLRLRGVIGDGEQLERGERTEDHVDVVALGELLGLGLGAGGVAARVGDDQLHLAPGERVVPVLEEADGALLHLDAARGERPGLHREQSDLDGLWLRERGRPQRGRQRGADQESTTSDGHGHGLLLEIVRDRK